MEGLEWRLSLSLNQRECSKRAAQACTGQVPCVQDFPYQ